MQAVRVRVPVRACMRVGACVCAGVACMRDGVRADGAGVRCLSVPVSVCVGVIVLSVCVRV